jgi:hypothetical protein
MRRRAPLMAARDRYDDGLLPANEPCGFPPAGAGAGQALSRGAALMGIQISSPPIPVRGSNSLP